jgi:hypothetical protein
MLHTPGVEAHTCIGIDFAPYNNLCRFLNKNIWAQPFANTHLFLCQKLYLGSID